MSFAHIFIHINHIFKPIYIDDRNGRRFVYLYAWLLGGVQQNPVRNAGTARVQTNRCRLSPLDATRTKPHGCWRHRTHARLDKILPEMQVLAESLWIDVTCPCCTLHRPDPIDVDAALPPQGYHIIDDNILFYVLLIQLFLYNIILKKSELL